jgi:hypothetical protein
MLSKLQVMNLYRLSSRLVAVPLSYISEAFPSVGQVVAVDFKGTDEGHLL